MRPVPRRGNRSLGIHSRGMIAAMYRLAYDSRDPQDPQMFDAEPIRPGDLVRDRKLGLIWTVVNLDLEGRLELECNGVIASASRWEVVPLTI